MTRAKQCTRSVPTLTYMSTSCMHPPAPPVTLPPLCLAALLSVLLSFCLSFSLSLFQHPLQRCTFQPIAYRIRLQCAGVHLPHSIRTTPRRRTAALAPRPPFSLSLSLFPSPGLPAGDGAIDALHRVTKLETKRKALKCPSFLMHPRMYRKLFCFFLPFPVGTRGDFSQTQYRKKESREGSLSAFVQRRNSLESLMR